MRKTLQAAIIFFCGVFTLSAQIPTNGLVAKYSFNGNLTQDDQGSYPLSNTGATLTTGYDGQSNSAALFTGNAVMSVNDAVFRPTSFSIATRFYISGSNPYHTLANVRINQSSSPYNAYNLCTGTSVGNKLAFYYTTSSGNDVLVQGSASLQGGWRHGVVTVDYNGTNTSVKLYADGLLIGQSTTAGSIQYPISNPLTLGNIVGASNQTNALNGSLDEFLFYNRVLSASEITAISLGCIVSIPDANFKTYLLNNTAVNTNGDTEIQCDEAANFAGQISCESSGIMDITGIEAFVNLTQLNVANNNISAIDLSQNPDLFYVRIAGNPITSIDVSGNIALTQFDVANCHQLTALDLSSNSSLQALAAGNSNLNSLNLANGNNTNITYAYLANCNNLTCIQVDNAAYSNANWTGNNYLKPAGAFYSEVCGTVSVNEIMDKNRIGIYPNPVSSLLTIEAKEPVQISIINILGEEITEQTINGYSVIDVSELNPGVYFISNNNSSHRIKFIKE